MDPLHPTMQPLDSTNCIGTQTYASPSAAGTSHISNSSVTGNADSPRIGRNETIQRVMGLLSTLVGSYTPSPLTSNASNNTTMDATVNTSNADTSTSYADTSTGSTNPSAAVKPVSPVVELSLSGTPPPPVSHPEHIPIEDADTDSHLDMDTLSESNINLTATSTYTHTNTRGDSRSDQESDRTDRKRHLECDLELECELGLDVDVDSISSLVVNNTETTVSSNTDSTPGSDAKESAHGIDSGVSGAGTDSGGGSNKRARPLDDMPRTDDVLDISNIYGCMDARYSIRSSMSSLSDNSESMIEARNSTGSGTNCTASHDLPSSATGIGSATGSIGTVPVGDALIIDVECGHAERDDLSTNTNTDDHTYGSHDTSSSSVTVCNNRTRSLIPEPTDIGIGIGIGIGEESDTSTWPEVTENTNSSFMSAVSGVMSNTSHTSDTSNNQA